MALNLLRNSNTCQSDFEPRGGLISEEKSSEIKSLSRGSMAAYCFANFKSFEFNLTSLWKFRNRQNRDLNDEYGGIRWSNDIFCHISIEYSIQWNGSSIF